ncbi:MAG TPA: division/cell wall cluster transcriptional repressor MraZ [Anaerolineae bacterium]|nr:division/cell wall cluster transcriptional repressor MraZ [Anaerolineae bacterium]
MFFGEHEHSLDEKGRLILPARYRAAFEQGFFLTRGLENCLWMFTMPVWHQLTARLSESGLSSLPARQLDRLLYSGSEGPLDKQGRLLIPPSLRSFAGLAENDPVVVVGVKNRIELWNLDRWQALTAQLGENGSDFATALGELGLDL